MKDLKKGEAMDKEKAVQKMTEVMAKFVGYTGKVLPDDVTAKLSELAERETQPLAKEIYKTMFENQRLAKQLDRPSCQDTGVIQFFVRCGANFPLIGELEELLREAVLRATRARLRYVTTASRRLTSTTPAKTSARARLACFGRSCRKAASARYTPTWRAAAVACPARRPC